MVETNPQRYAGGITTLSTILQTHCSHFVDLLDAKLRVRPIAELNAITTQRDILVYREPESSPVANSDPVRLADL